MSRPGWVEPRNIGGADDDGAGAVAELHGLDKVVESAEDAGVLVGGAHEKSRISSAERRSRGRWRGR